MTELTGSDAVVDFMHRRAQVLEEVCEAALVGGEHGVSMWTWTPTDTEPAIGMCFAARVDPAVPYGTIHAHNSPPPES